MPDSGSATSSVRAQVEGREWYHSIELAPGLVTPGWFDTRSVVPLLPFPASLDGMRALDVGTFDGFWALEMERRGAKEVVAIDVLDPYLWDWPVGSSLETVRAVGKRKDQGSGFEVVRAALGSSVRRLEMSVYDLDPSEVGQFDFVYVGSLLLHLRDPIGALTKVRSVCRGQLLVVDAIDLELTLLHPRRPVAGLDGLGRPWWWKPNLAALVRMVEAAGFRSSGPPRRLFMPLGAGQAKPIASARSLLRRPGREALVTARRGDPHGAVLAVLDDSPGTLAGRAAAS